jgi:hypothetical protein
MFTSANRFHLMPVVMLSANHFLLAEKRLENPTVLLEIFSNSQRKAIHQPATQWD